MLLGRGEPAAREGARGRPGDGDAGGGRAVVGLGDLDVSQSLLEHGPPGCGRGVVAAWSRQIGALAGTVRIGSVDPDPVVCSSP